MPMVVAEACQFSKCIICSNNTGSADLIRESNAGMVYFEDDPDQLYECIVQIHKAIKNGSTGAMRNNARDVYERYFSETVFYSNLNDTLSEIMDKRTAMEETEKVLAEIQRENIILTKKTNRLTEELRKTQEEKAAMSERLETIEQSHMWRKLIRRTVYGIKKLKR